MTLGVLLNIGESLASLKASGQDRRFVDYYLKKYVQEFDKVYVFSYAKERYKLPKKSLLISNKAKLHRFIYTFLMPIFYFREFKKCDVFRVTHLLGSIPAIMAKVFYGKKFVVTYGYDYKEFASIEGKSYLKPLISFIEFLNFKLANGIIVTTEEFKTYVAKRIDKRKIFYIPNGVDVRLFKPKSKVKSQKSKVRILFVGRLEKQKNLFTLIKAVALLKDRENILLEFVGGGSLKQRLERAAERLGVNLQILEKFSYDKMPSVYQRADIFILPSLVEGHPKVLLEAMACGLSCIGNHIRSIKTIIKDGKNGLIFDKSANDLHQKIGQLLASQKLSKQLEREARDFILKKFDFQELIEKEIKILK